MEYIALIGIILLTGLALFQLALIFGAPLGEYAWGGQNKVLTKKLRVSSAISILLYIIFAVFLVSKAGLVGVVTQSTFLTVGMWVFGVYFCLGIIMNAVSRSKKERIVMTPVAAMLAIVFISVVQLS